MSTNDNGKEIDLRSELLSREPLPGREARFTADGREILLYRCSECGFTIETTQLPEHYTCPLCDAGAEFFIEVDYHAFPIKLVNVPWQDE